MPYFSIVIPAYNSEKTIVSCLKSVLNQTFHDFEVIIIDDGSVDDTSKLCHYYVERDNRIIIVSQKNEGVSAARNVGIREAEGEYIIFLDSDDCLCRDACFNLAEILKKYEPEIVIGGFQILCGKRKMYEVPNKKYISRKYNGFEALGRTLKYKVMSGVVWGKAFKRSYILQNALVFDEKLENIEDNKFMYQLYEKAKTVYFLDSPIYQYVIGKDTLTTRQTQNDKCNRYSNCLKVIDYIKNSLFAHEYKDRYVAKCYINRIYMSAVLNNNIIKSDDEMPTFIDILIYEATIRERIKALLFVVSPKLCLGVRNLYAAIGGFKRTKY